jgi:DNA polymerase elongation subunit (family B)
MKVFIYNWELREKSPKVVIVAHSMNKQGKYIPIVINSFKPFCYLEQWKTRGVDSLYSEEVILKSSTDINNESVYECLYFENCDQMTESCGYMSDINPITMFLSKNKFPFTGWFETDPKLRPLDEVRSTYPKVACFDIECISRTGYGMPKPYRRGDTIEMISILTGKYLEDYWKRYLIYVGEEDEIEMKDCICICCQNEWQLIQEFGSVIKDEDPDIITGYNIFGFDFDYILKKCQLRLKPFPEISRNGKTKFHYMEWESSAYGINYYNVIESSGRVFIDMMLFFQRKNLGSYSLDFVSKKYLNEGKKEISHEKVWRDRSLIQEYAEYCIHDSELTMRLFNMFYMWTDVCEMSRVMICSIEDIYTRGEQIKVLNQVVYSCISRGIVLKRLENKEPWKELKGAFVFEPNKGLYEKCVVVDFQSMYPSIMISYNICPSTYIRNGKFTKKQKGILPNIAEQLLSERKKVKDEMKEKSGIMKQILESRQYSLKISANSLYGVLGFEKNKYLGHYECSSTITSIGRDMLIRVADYINNSMNLDVIYGDTDSCVICFDKKLNKEECISKARDVCSNINEFLPKPMFLNFEAYYDIMLFFAKKKYVMFNGEDVTFKGVATVRSNYCPFVKKCYREIIGLIGKRATIDEIKLYITTSVIELMEGLVPIDDLVLTKSVKPLERYKTTNTPQYIMANRLLLQGENWQSKLEYIFVSNNKKLQGEKMYTPDEVEKNRMSVDYKYYLKRQLIPSIKDLLSVVGLEDFCRHMIDRVVPSYYS